MADYSKIAESMVRTSEQFIESSNREIEWLNKRIAEQRKEDREFVEYVWSSGVVDEVEMMIYTKDYKSRKMKELLKARDREYRWRREQRKCAERWKNWRKF